MSSSPGLVYPLLEKLAAEGLIEEAINGRYVITKKGSVQLESYRKIKQELSEKYDMLTSLSVSGNPF